MCRVGIMKALPTLKFYIIKILMAITMLLMMAFTTQNNVVLPIGSYIAPTVQNNYWNRWFYWHRWSESQWWGGQYYTQMAKHTPTLKYRVMSFT